MKLLIVLLSALLIPYSLAQDSSSELEFGGLPLEQGPSPDGPMFPRFLMHVPSFARKEFFDIVSNEQLSQDQQNQQLTIWAKAFNVTEEFNTWVKQIQQQKEQVSRNVQAVVANISNVYNQLEDILSNTNLTRRDQHDEIRKLSVTFPREVRALFFIARNYRPESRTPIFGFEQKPRMEGMKPFGFPQQPSHSMMMFTPQSFIFGRGMMNRFQQNGPNGQFNGIGNQNPQDFGAQNVGTSEQPQEPNMGLQNQNSGYPFVKKQFPRGSRYPMNSDSSEGSSMREAFDSENRRGPRGPERRGRRGDGPRFGPGQGPDFGPRPQGGRGQGPYFGPRDDFPGRRGPGGPSFGPGQRPDFGPRPQGGSENGPSFGPEPQRGLVQVPGLGPHDDFPGRRGPGGPGEGRGGRGNGPSFGPGQGPDFGPRPEGDREQGPYFGPRPQGGRGGRGNGPSFGPGQGPNFGPGPQGGRGQGPDFGPQDNFPGRRGPGGPEGRGQRGDGPNFGPGQGPDFGPQDDFPGRRGPGGPEGPSFGPGPQRVPGQRPDFGPRPEEGRGGRGDGPSFGPGQGPNFGPGPQGGRGQGPDFGTQDDFPGRRGPGGPGGPSFGPGPQRVPGQGPDIGPRPEGDRRQGPNFIPRSQSQDGRQFDDSNSSPSSSPSLKYFERQSNSKMRFDQSSGFGMNGGISKSIQQNDGFANN